MMGDYLDMVHNDKPHPENNTEPNENYAREVMQLFTIGLYNSIPTAPGNSMVKINLSRPTIRMWWKVSRMSLPDGIGRRRARRLGLRAGLIIGSRCWRFRTITTPAQATSGRRDLPRPVPGQDLHDALDVLFNHPNAGPFVCRELIQRLVTSNPSPAYIGRVAQVFANNGQGVRAI